jgi:KaiC/GvpD/RAD55 family RecA-like ATPase
MLTFRSILKSYEDKNETSLYSSLLEIEKAALESWSNQLGEKNGSYNGIPHLKGVELHINNAVPDQLKKEFSSTEIFLLLSSVLLHDIGKLFKTDCHAADSAIYIQENWAFLKIPSKQFSRWIAILSCSHFWNNPTPSTCSQEDKEKCSLVCETGNYSELDILNESSDGTIRLKWLAALLRLADEVDNQASRAVPEELEKSVKKLSWRRLINSVIFDREGECIKLRMVSLENQNDLESTDYNYINEAIGKINTVLNQWASPLNEMSIKYKEAFIEVSIPVPALIPAREIAVEKFNNTRTIIQCSFEPAFEEYLLEKLSKTMIKLENSIIDKGLISWESLAEEVGFNNSLLAKKMAFRLNCICICKDKAPRYNYNFINEIKSIIISDAGWNLKEYSTPNSKHKALRKPEVISTNIVKLDSFLFPDSKSDKKGFTIFTMRDGRKLTPIIAIVGSSGEGKTTLSLQIASNLIKGDGDWCSVYYSLEQEPSRIIQQLDGHQFLIDAYKNNVINLEIIKFNSLKKADFLKKIIFPKLSPKPVDIKSVSHERLFEERYNELRISIKNFKKKKNKHLFYFIDSLTAFSHQSLTRSEINRIFSLFREEEVPLIVTLERQMHWAITNEETHYNYAKYLSDVIISIESDYKDDYFKQTIEVTKSRYTRRILGKHLMKLQSKDNKATGKFDNRTGIVIYPSVHNHLVQNRYEKSEKVLLPTRLPADLPIFSNKEKNAIDSDSCVVITGPHGSHKLALGINILLGFNILPGKVTDATDQKRKLIISFSEEKEMKLEDVALFSELTSFWKFKLKKIENQDAADGSKVWEFNFGKDEKNIYVTILNFRLGQIQPEEFFYILNEYLIENKDFDSVLITTTAQIKTRFPLLNKEPLFFPVLVDIIKSKGLFSIFIDALDKDNDAPQAALQSAADCAIFIERDTKTKENFLTVENIRGKNYDRIPRIYEVKDKELRLTLKIVKRKDKKSQHTTQAHT